MDEKGIYEKPNTSRAQETTDVSRPTDKEDEGSGAGGNKVDPVSGGPNVAKTLAGRDRTGEGDVPSGGRKQPADFLPYSTARDGRMDRPTGGPDTDGQGTTGSTGRESGEGLEATKAAAAEDINAGESETGGLCSSS